MAKFLKMAGDLSRWNVYRKSAVICDVTEMFIRRAFSYQTRTVDQMRQAARSCKQNLVEGVSDCTVSMEMGIKLVGVARSSLRELREDYLDYLYQNDCEILKPNTDIFNRMRNFCIECDDRKEFVIKCRPLKDAIIANIMVTQSTQLDSMTATVLQKMEDEFVKEGGLKETMGQVRREWRKQHLGF